MKNKKKQNTKNKNVTYIIIIIVILVGAFLLSKQAKQKEQQDIENIFDREIILDVQEFEEQGVQHISEAGQFEYNSNPPTSGPHYAQAPAWGFYDNQIDDESALHAVEHGGVWVSYKNTNEDEINLLKDFAKKNSGSVVVTLRENNNSKIAAVAWTKLVEFENLDIDALQKFLLLNKNNTHEPLAK